MLMWPLGGRLAATGQVDPAAATICRGWCNLGERSAVKRTLFPRRLLAGAAGLAVGLAGMATLSTPAHATVDQQFPVDIEVNSTCDELSFLIVYSADGDGDLELQIKAGPAIETVTIEPGDTHEASFFTRVSYEVFLNGNLIKEGEWEDPGDCGDATVLVDWEFECDAITLEVTAPRTFEIVLIMREDDEQFLWDVEPGATTTLTLFDATEGTVVVITYDGDVVETIAWEEPEGCGEPATEQEKGSAGELAATGSPTLWIAGVAVALLTVGVGLYILTRRRFVHFTA